MWSQTSECMLCGCLFSFLQTQWKEMKEKEKKGEAKVRKNLLVVVGIVLSLSMLSSLVLKPANAGGTPVSLRTMVSDELNWLTTQEVVSGSYAWWTYGGVANVGLTALCVLDYVNFGVLSPSYPNELNWILSQQQSDGSITSPAVGGSRMQRGLRHFNGHLSPHRSEPVPEL